jgi:2,3-dihydroxybiphenyl 1,2-dioxygenase
MSVSQLGYLGFGVSDLDAWETYATEVLGMEVSGRADDGTLYLRMDENHQRISLHPNGHDDLAYVGWQTRNRKEFEKTKAKLLEGGVEYEHASDEELENRHVMDMVKFTGSGIRMEVFYGPHVLLEEPFRAGRGISGFKTGDLGLGHLGLNPDDGNELRRILLDCLGFEVSDSIGGERFFHCNAREHTAVIARTFTPGRTRIDHFMVELNSINDVGLCLDIVEDRGIELTSRLGRHTNDHMISFYMKTPSGFGVEYGWGGRLVDDSTWQVNRYDTASMWGHRPTPKIPPR